MRVPHNNKATSVALDDLLFSQLRTGASLIGLYVPCPDSDPFSTQQCRAVLKHVTSQVDTLEGPPTILRRKSNSLSPLLEGPP